MGGLRTRSRTDVDPPRVELPSAGGISSRRPRGDNLFTAYELNWTEPQFWTLALRCDSQPTFTFTHDSLTFTTHELQLAYATQWKACVQNWTGAQSSSRAVKRRNFQLCFIIFLNEAIVLNSVCGYYTTPTAVLRPLYRSTWMILLVHSFTIGMPLLVETIAFGLGRRRWSSHRQCYLHCLRTFSML